jgi:hypothetical protein
MCFTSRACFEIDRPSWLNGSHPHAPMPITLPATSRLPLVAIGTRAQIPCRHGPTRVHSRCRIYDCMRFLFASTYRSVSCFLGESIYAGLGGFMLNVAD